MAEVQYTPDVIARNVKQLGNGVIEVRCYLDGYIRTNLSWVWFLCLTAVLIYDFFTDQSMFHDMKWVISVDWVLRPEYEEHSQIFAEMGKSFRNYSEFKAGMMKAHGDNLYYGLFYLLFYLFWLYMVISPRWRPMRFDAKRRLVYFQYWGQLYIMHYPKAVQRNRQQLLDFLDPEMFTPKLRQQPHGSLVFTLPHADRAKKRKCGVPLGIDRPACTYQNSALLIFLLDYLGSDNPDEEFAQYFKKEKRITSDYFNWFHQFSLFPDRGYNEKKTEAKIQEWLDRYY